MPRLPVKSTKSTAPPVNPEQKRRSSWTSPGIGHGSRAAKAWTSASLIGGSKTRGTGWPSSLVRGCLEASRTMSRSLIWRPRRPAETLQGPTELQIHEAHERHREGKYGARPEREERGPILCHARARTRRSGASRCRWRSGSRSGSGQESDDAAARGFQTRAGSRYRRRAPSGSDRGPASSGGDCRTGRPDSLTDSHPSATANSKRICPKTSRISCSRSSKMKLDDALPDPNPSVAPG